MSLEPEEESQSRAPLDGSRGRSCGGCGSSGGGSSNRDPSPPSTRDTLIKRLGDVSTSAIGARIKMRAALAGKPASEQAQLLVDGLLAASGGQTARRADGQEGAVLVLAELAFGSPEASQVYGQALHALHERDRCRTLVRLMRNHQPGISTAAAHALRWLADSDAGPQVARQLAAGGGLGSIAGLLNSGHSDWQLAAATAIGGLAVHAECALELERSCGGMLARLGRDAKNAALGEAADAAWLQLSKTVAPMHAAAEAAAEAMAAALLAEEEAEAAQLTAKAAAKAAKRQRQKQQQRQQQQQRRQEQLADAEPPQAGEAADAAPTEAVNSSSGGGSGASPQQRQQKQQQQPPRQQKRDQASAAAAGAAVAAVGVAAVAAAAAQPEGSESAGLDDLLQHLGLGDAQAPAAPAPASTPASTGGKQPLVVVGDSSIGLSSGGAWLPAAPPVALDVHALAELCCCPITCAPFRDPVTAADGHAYERRAIEDWIAREQAAGRQPASPLTGLPLPILHLHPCLIARGFVAALQAAGQLQH